MTDRKPHVFLVQVPTFRDRSGAIQERDVSAAEDFGEVVEIWGPRANPLGDVDYLRDQAEKVFDDHSLQVGDYIALSGSSALIGLACAIAADRLDGTLQMLQFGSGTYAPVTALIGDDNPNRLALSGEAV